MHEIKGTANCQGCKFVNFFGREFNWVYSTVTDQLCVNEMAVLYTSIFRVLFNFVYFYTFQANLNSQTCKIERTAKYMGFTVLDLQTTTCSEQVQMIA